MSVEEKRRIVLLRHAKSDHPEGMDDWDRPLADRGRRDAPAAGRWLAERGIAPDLCLCSPAARTRETWKLAVHELPQRPPTVYEERIYAAAHSALLSLLRETPDDVRTLLLVGHNPGMHSLAVDLADDSEQEPDGSGQESLGMLIQDHFPTCAIAVIAFTGPWANVQDGIGELEGYWAPR
jgi:phosphohistidine phosphatase